MKGELEKYDAALSQKHYTEWYNDMPSIRAFIQLIPWVGGSIDTVLGMPGYFFAQERIDKLFHYAGEALSKVEQEFVHKDWSHTEEFQDIIRIAIESSSKSRSDEKIRTNAMILSNVLIIDNKEGYLPEEYLLALQDLTPLEVSVLFTFYNSIENYAGPKGVNDMQTLSKTNWRDEINEQCGVDHEDINFIMKRIERTGLIGEMTGSYLGYVGGQFMVNGTFKKLIEYLSLNPLSRVS